MRKGKIGPWNGGKMARVVFKGDTLPNALNFSMSLINSIWFG